MAVIPSDPTQIDILVFTNGTVSDVTEEVPLETAALSPIGGVVTTFDGGDGSALAWSTALAAIDVLVLPELEDGGAFYEVGGTPIVSDAAAASITAWVQAGGVVIMNGSISTFNYGPMLSSITGKDYASVFGVSDDDTLVYNLQGVLAGAPASVGYADGTYSLEQYGAWSADLKSIVEPIYLTADQQNLAVGNFAAGAGYVTYIAYDWYPNGEAAIADWEAILRLAATGLLVNPAAFPAAPALAATGVAPELPVAAAGAMLLIGAALLVKRSRRIAAA